MTTNKLTIIAQMRDELTGPLKHAQKVMDSLAAASRKSAAAADMQSKAFERLAKAQGLATDKAGRWRNEQGHYVSNARVMEAAAQQQIIALNKASGATGKQAKAFEAMAFAAGWTITAQGRVRDAQGRYVSSTNVAVARTMANAAAHRKLGVAQQETKVYTEKLGASMNGFNARTVRIGSNMERLAQTFGAGSVSARRFGLGLANSIDHGAISRGVDAYNRNLDRMRRHTENVTNGIKNAFSKVGKAMAVGGGVLAGYTLAAGLKRHQAFQTADVRLEVLDFTEEQRKNIKDTTDRLVTNTPIPLDAAMTGGQKILAAGIEYEDYERRMKTMVDATSLYSAFDPEQLPHVMGQITSKRYLTGEEMLQLAELGMNPTRVMAEHLEVPLEDIMPMVEAKEITADMWWDALEPWVKDGAKKMGETFAGAFLTLKASVGRVGEDFETPLLEPLEKLMRGVSGILDGAEPIWLAFGDAAAGGVNILIDLLPQIEALFWQLAPAMIELAQATAKVLPRLIQGFIIWLNVISPVIDPLTRILAVILEITAFALPVLVPLLFAAGAGFTAWKVLSIINGLLMIFWPTLNIATVAMTAARFAVNLLTRSIMLFPGMWIIAAVLAVVLILKTLYEEVEAVRVVFDALADGFRHAEEWLNNFGESVDRFFQEHFPQLDKISKAIAAPLNALQGGLNKAGYELGQSTGLHEMMGTAKYDEAGNPLSYEAMVAQKEGEGGHFTPAPTTTAEDELGRMGLPGMGGNRYTGRGTSAEDELGGMGLPGYAEGGWTAPGPHVVGERGSEFITQSWAAHAVEANHPGALATMNATGQLPAGDTVVHAPIYINGAQDPQAIAVAVRAEITRIAREDSRAYMKTTVRGAG